MIPSTDIGEGDLHTEIGFDQLRQLTQAVAEASLGVIRTRCRCVLTRIGGLQHLHGVESLLSGAVQD